MLNFKLIAYALVGLALASVVGHYIYLNVELKEARVENKELASQNALLSDKMKKLVVAFDEVSKAKAKLEREKQERNKRLKELAENDIDVQVYLSRPVPSGLRLYHKGS